MRKLAIALAGAAALAMTSTANAALTITSTAPAGISITGPSTSGTTSTFGFSAANLSQGAFDYFITFTSDLAAIFNASVTTSTPSVTFSSVTLNGIALTDTYASQNFNLIPAAFFDANTPLTLEIVGNNSASSGSFGGSITASSPVPEPATWGLMLLGFGGMGVAIRRGRKSKVRLAQVA